MHSCFIWRIVPYQRDEAPSLCMIKVSLVLQWSPNLTESHLKVMWPHCSCLYKCLYCESNSLSFVKWLYFIFWTSAWCHFTSIHKQSCGKVMFLHPSVSHSVYRGVSAPGVCSFCWNFSERQILWSLCLVDFHTLTLQLPIQTPHSVAPELQVFVSSLKISAKRAHPSAC